MDKLARTILSIRQLSCRGCKRPLNECNAYVCMCCAEAYCAYCANVVRAYLGLTRPTDHCLAKGWAAVEELVRKMEFEILEREPDDPIM